MAADDSRLHVGAAEIQVAVFQPQVLLDAGMLQNLERRGRFGEDPELTDLDLNLAGRDFEVFEARSRTTPRAGKDELPAYGEAFSKTARSVPSSKVSCTMPVRSRRSIKINCPRSRWRCTQPQTVTSAPMSAGRRSPQVVRPF